MAAQKRKQNSDANAGLKMVGGAAAGAAAGALIGPVGAAIGAVVGGIAGANARQIAKSGAVKKLKSATKRTVNEAMKKQPLKKALGKASHLKPVAGAAKQPGTKKHAKRAR